MESIYWYATPAFVALAIKIWLAINSNKRRLIIKNWPLAMFFLSISIFNIIEVVTYTTTFAPVFYSIFIKLYNGSILLSLCFLMIFSAKLAEFRIFTDTGFPTFYAGLSLAFFILLISTNLFISGYEVVGYGFTRIPGKYFQIPLIFALVNLILSFIFLFYGFLRNNIKQINKRRCKAILISYLPFMICIMILMLLMETGIKITGAIIIPFTTSYLLIVLVFTESEKDLFNFLLKTPFTDEYKTLKFLTRNLQEFLTESSIGNKVNLKTLSNSIEKQLIAHAVSYYEGNQANAAKSLGISASSISRKK